MGRRYPGGAWGSVHRLPYITVALGRVACRLHGVGTVTRASFLLPTLFSAGMQVFTEAKAGRRLVRDLTRVLW